MTALSDELKPCPFCGGAASLHPRTCDKNTPYNPADRAFPVARCGQCGAEALGKDWGKPETAAEKWNARAVVARDWHRAYQQCLDGLPLKAGMHHTVPAGCWFPRDIRMLVEQLLATQPLKAEQAKDAAEDARTQTHKAEDAPSDAELLDSRGKIRSDLKSSAYCVGNEYKPFHPRASHVRPEWRDGWNACFVAAIAQERKAP